ncbi:MAG: DUF5606 domain-containing protein [Bacteroidales bacterium]|nr:DUF5606 domain-containing protein [Bacteroidales bacterium]
MATDLKKVLAISGEPGLFEYLAQGKNGFIVESMVSGRRLLVSASSKVTSLSDVSIYTETDEVTLRSVLEAIRDNLSSAPAMSSKSDPAQIKAFFAQVLPDYDRDRFYVSHMKKVLDWYNVLQVKGALEFEDEESVEGQAASEE